MATRGRGRRGGRNNQPPPPAFDQQAFMEAMGAMTATFLQASSNVGQGGSNNLQKFRSHNPPTFVGGGDPMVADNWFQQVDKILEAMEIVSDATKIRLAIFQFEGDAHQWWTWAKPIDIGRMTWGEFQELFMKKYFPPAVREVKAHEFLNLKQGAMTVMQYVAKFTELARFADDYVATDLAKVRRFENGLKLSIRGKIVGHRLHEFDEMVETAMAIEREVEDAKRIREAGSKDRKKEGQFSTTSSGKRQKISTPPGDREISCNFRVRHRPLPLHERGLRSQARAWAEAGDRAFRPGLQGPRGESSPSHHRFYRQISQ
ncbi:unnamed protein product [Ilex paraguariensis]